MTSPEISAEVNKFWIWRLLTFLKYTRSVLGLFLSSVPFSMPCVWIDNRLNSLWSFVGYISSTTLVKFTEINVASREVRRAVRVQHDPKSVQWEWEDTRVRQILSGFCILVCLCVWQRKHLRLWWNRLPSGLTACVLGQSYVILTSYVEDEDVSGVLDLFCELVALPEVDQVWQLIHFFDFPCRWNTYLSNYFPSVRLSSTGNSKEEK